MKQVETIIRGVFARLERQHSGGGGIVGVPTGLDELDELVTGWLPATLNLIRGESADQVSALVLQMAGVAALGVCAPLAYFSLGASTERTILRLLASLAGLPVEAVLKASLRDEQWASLIGAVGRLGEMPMFCNEVYDLSVDDVAERCEALVEAHGYCAVFIDSLEGLRPCVAGESIEAQHLRAVVELKRLAVRLQIPVMVGSTLVREASRVADVVVELTPEGALSSESSDAGWPYEATLWVVQNAQGPTGAVDVAYDPRLRRFGDPWRR